MLEIFVHTAMGLGMTVGIVFILALLLWAAYLSLDFSLRMQGAIHQHIGVFVLKRKGISTDISRDDRMEVIKMMTKHGLKFGDACRCLDDIGKQFEKEEAISTKVKS